ncbi:hypothetical protein RBG61_12765 [Paludicola sp. MB14-C6]|uniref:hypothetical protein n=1 Tax=Paludihabitans sp. MB14-C6 TaxID=3070656 RepID=UPI0027DAB782|nr:hypothetical protein [Paludicola sp. MB14-C6]WMJ22849.1 hypothetical protein RBG61_12765 [Paludicola sp. MB14-C6]
MIRKWEMVITYSIAHFIIDFACAIMLFSMLLGTETWYLCVLIYNFCAFAMQMPLGLIADKWNRNAIFACIGCMLVALSFGFIAIPMIAAIVAGIGNGMFHVGGGIDVLNMSHRKSSALGVFVSPGAFGIYFGRLLGKQHQISLLLILAVLLLITMFILITQYHFKKSFLSDNSPLSFQVNYSNGILLAVVCLFLVVCLRSYVGMLLNFTWKAQWQWAVILTCGVVFGKCSGGFVSDKFGAIKASAFSLGIASLLFLFAQNPIIGILGVFLFNMTMPITLWAIARILPGAKGFTFGLLTFGLFLGFIPVYLGLPPLFTSNISFAVASLLSLLLLFFGLKKGGNYQVI